MTLQEALKVGAEFARLGLTMRLEGDELVVTGESQLLSHDLIESLRSRKAELVEVLRSLTEAPDEPEFAPQMYRPDRLPLSSAQSRLYLLHQLADHVDDPYAEARALLITGAVDLGELQEAVNELVDAHEVLRTTISVGSDGVPFQRLARSGSIHIETLCVERDGRANADIAASSVMELIAERFDLAAGPLVRLRVINFDADPQSHVLVAVLHHIVGDGWSLGVFVEQVAQLYSARVAGTASPPRPAVQYADYALAEHEWLDTDAAARACNYWRDRLATFQQVAIPAHDSESPRVARISALIPAEVADATKRAAGASGASLFMTLTCAWRLAARVVIGSGAVLLVTDVANRTASVDRTIGCFTNQVVLAGLVDDGCTLADQLDEERSLILDAFDHSRLPYDEMVRTTQPTRRGGDDPYGQLKVVLQNIPPREVIVGGIQIAPIDLLPIRAKNDILVNAVEHAGGLLVDVDYRADRYEAATISRLLSAFHTAFERLATHRDTSVAELVEVAVARLEALDARNASIFASTARNMLAGGLDRAPGTTR